MFLKPLTKTCEGLDIKTPEKSSIYPLMHDHRDLTAAGKRLSRINACSLQRTSDEYVAAWNFFRRAYLYPMEACQLYAGDITESPPFHYEMVHAMAEYHYATRACPRGFAKSTITDENILLRSFTRPLHATLMCLASHDLLEERFGIFQDTLINNEFLQQDFPGLIPKKNEGQFNLSMIQLKNGARIKGVVTHGKKRGTKPRPHWIVLDDPEYDPSETSDMGKIRREFKRRLFQVLIPCGAKESQLWWPGTIISRQLSLYAANSGTDPQFEMWNHRIYSAYDKERNPLWPQQFDMEWLENKKLVLQGSFGAEYMNQPGESGETTFSIHESLNSYHVDRTMGLSPYQDNAPVSSEVVVKVDDRGRLETEEVEEPLSDLVRKLQIIMLVDSAVTATADSDYSAITIQGFDRKNDVMWVLDAWQGKVKEEVLIEKIIELGQLWLPRLVGIEAISLQLKFYEAVSAKLKDLPATRWQPKSYPIKYGSHHNMSKENRIGGIAWRFSTYRIKLPLHLSSQPHWSELIEQIRDFQQETKNGNLQYDDLLDTLAMSQYVAKSSERAKYQEDVRPVTAIDKIRRHEYQDPNTGINLVSALDISKLTCEDIHNLSIDAYERGLETGRNSLKTKIGI